MTYLTKTFEVERETKRTKRFKELGDEASQIMGTAYVSKVALGKLGDPDKIEVTIGPPASDNEDED